MQNYVIIITIKARYIIYNFCILDYNVTKIYKNCKFINDNKMELQKTSQFVYLCYNEYIFKENILVLVNKIYILGSEID